MSLAPDLTDEIRKAAESQGLDPTDALAVIEQVVGDDEVLDWFVWGGPGLSQENLTLDVYILSPGILYNYAGLKEGEIHSGMSANILASISSVSLVDVEHERSNKIIILRTASGETSRLFGNRDLAPKMERFMRATLKAILEARR